MVADTISVAAVDQLPGLHPRHGAQRPLLPDPRRGQAHAQPQLRGFPAARRHGRSRGHQPHRDEPLAWRSASPLRAADRRGLPARPLLRGAAAQDRQEPRATCAPPVEESVIDNLERGNTVMENKTLLHTAPHHDDIILGYLPYFTNVVRRSSTKHCFAYMTSGFNAVTNHYMQAVVEDLTARLERGDVRQAASRRLLRAAQRHGPPASTRRTTCRAPPATARSRSRRRRPAAAAQPDRAV